MDASSPQQVGSNYVIICYSIYKKSVLLFKETNNVEKLLDYVRRCVDDLNADSIGIRKRKTLIFLPRLRGEDA